MCDLYFYDVFIVVSTTTTKRGIPESPKHEEQFQNSTKSNTREKTHANNDLTRFGLNAYVPGAIKERLYYFGRSITILAAPLISKELQFFFQHTTKP